MSKRFEFKGVWITYTAQCTALLGADWHRHVLEAAQHSQRMSVTPQGEILSRLVLFRSSGVKEDIAFGPVSWYLKFKAGPRGG